MILERLYPVVARRFFDDDTSAVMATIALLVQACVDLRHLRRLPNVK